MTDDGTKTMLTYVCPSSHCARAACRRYIGPDDINVFKHKHLPWRYCLPCARKINAACPEAPPFDLSGVPAEGDP